MKWQDAMQFVVMVLLGAAIPLSWQLGLWTALLLAAVSLVKIFADHRDRRHGAYGPAPAPLPTNGRFVQNHSKISKNLVTVKIFE